MDIHVISLINSTHRRASIDRQLRKLNLPYLFYDAVSGVSLDPTRLSDLVDMDQVSQYPGWLTPNAIGCALSHLGVYRRIAESTSNWHLVLEDDMILDNSLSRILPLFDKILDHLKNDLILLYANNNAAQIELTSNIELLSKGSRLYLVNNPIGIAAAGAYIIHRDTAIRLLYNNPKVRYAADSWGEFQSMKCFDKVYLMYPFQAKPAMYESTIGYVNQRTILFRIKNIIEQYRIPLLYQALKLHRYRLWRKTSKVVFL